MMKNFWTIVKKELTRIFRDRRMFFTTVLMPGLMIFLIYTMLGNAFENMDSEAVDAHISVVNNIDAFRTIMTDEEMQKKIKVTFLDIEESRIDEEKDRLLKGETDYLIVFEEDFETKVEAKEKPLVQTYYNPSRDASNSVNDYVVGALSALESAYRVSLFGDTTAFVSNIGQSDSLIYEENKLMGKTLSMMFPFLIITFLFSGAMSIGAESIAGEKERGTIATLLVTPVKRSHIAMGKIVSLAVISTLSALSSFIGILASLPKIIGMEINPLNIYGFGEYFGILCILLSTVFVIIAIISLISCFAKNVKEASLYVVPVYLLFMMVGMSSMFTQGETVQQAWLFLIPIYNSVQSLTEIFSFSFSYLHFGITLAVNLVLTVGMVYVLTKMFDSEKIMFSK